MLVIVSLEIIGDLSEAVFWFDLSSVNYANL